MTRFISFLFALSDAFAALLIAIAVPCIAIGLFMLVFGIPPRETPELTKFMVMVNCIIWAIASGGAYMLLRRQALGLLLVAVFVVNLFYANEFIPALASALVLAIVFLLPFILVFIQARKSATKSGAAT